MKRLLPALFGAFAAVAAAQLSTSPASREATTVQAGTHKVDATEGGAPSST